MKCGVAGRTLALVIFGLQPLFPGTAQADGKYGFESNVPTFLLDGHHGSVWYGENGRRARAVVAKAVYPGDLTEAGFKDKTLTFFELEFDFFFGEHAANFRGPWLASGFGRTRQEITSQSSGSRVGISTNDFHFGGGYTFGLTQRTTINPWVGGDYHLNSPDAVAVGNETWNPKTLGLVGGVKVGIDF